LEKLVSILLHLEVLVTHFIFRISFLAAKIIKRRDATFSFQKQDIKRRTKLKLMATAVRVYILSRENPPPKNKSNNKRRGRKQNKTGK
jgi:hypothetical protein